MPVAIVGAGPCGLAAAIALAQSGIPSVVFDRSCVCSSIVSYPTYMTFFSTAERLEIGGMPFPLAAEKPTRRDALAYYRTCVTHFGLAVRQYETVEQAENAGDGFVVHSRPRGGELRATRVRAIIVATGYFGTPNTLGVPGEELPHVTHLYREGHEAFQRHAVVVGGGNSAVECALDLWRCGAKVTLVHFGETFDKNIKPWVLPDFENRVKDGNIAARWNARVQAITPTTLQLHTLEGNIELPSDHVYLMTGFTPQPGLLTSLGVTFDDRTGVPAHDPRTMETPVRGVFVAGVLTAGFDANKIFIENGRGHGERIAARLRAPAMP
ncbi:MAG TPA: YpdA family putative bacillithiol disulfide reductase [Gemmatimonadaceae bacterium]|nr:YpdA family putative bacillithiol disulfide reductase [Gemmatimonadaceae bacterium]